MELVLLGVGRAAVFLEGAEREGRAVEVAGDGEGVGVSDAVCVDSAFDAEGNAVG